MIKYDQLTKKKNLLDQSMPLPQELMDNLNDWFLIELTYNSNAIEGNTLSLKETALVVEKGVTVGGKSLREHLEAVNHAEAIHWIRKQIKRRRRSINEQDILQIHHLILKGIDDVHAGRYRNVPVRISGSPVVLPNPYKVSSLMKELIHWLKKSHRLHPVQQAAEVHYRLVTIHPFIDGNGRTARLLMNMILMMKGYPMAVIRKRDRLAYISSLEKAQMGGSKDEYLRIITKAVGRSLDIYLKVAGEQEVSTL